MTSFPTELHYTTQNRHRVCPSCVRSKRRGGLGDVVLLEISLQRGQLPRAAAADDVLLREARGEDAHHDLGMGTTGGSSTVISWWFFRVI